MNRLFGNKNAATKPGLTEAIASTEARADGVTQKIKKLDQELSRYRDQMKKMGSGPGKVRPIYYESVIVDVARLMNLILSNRKQ